MKFGFTKKPGFYTHSTSVLDSRGRDVWVVKSIPKWWSEFGRPYRLDGRDGLMGSFEMAPDLRSGFSSDKSRYGGMMMLPARRVPLFYPLPVLHRLNLTGPTKR